MSNHFEQNLRDLADRDPGLSARLAAPGGCEKRYVFLTSRSGACVPAWIDSPGKERPLHSLVDPVREASRIIGAVEDAGFLVLFGLGGGFAAAAALAQESVQHVLVIEYGLESVAELFAAQSYRPLLQDPRFHLLVDPSAEAVKRGVVDYYQPALSGGIRVIPLRVRADADRPRFDEAAAGVQAGIAAVSADYSVQAYFGTRWFAQILRNLLRADPQAAPFPRVRRAAITAAGPSLDAHLPGLAENPQGAYLIAVDTSLPALLHAGIEPDAVVSIDCQHISYQHFLQGLPRHTALYLDLASPPLVASQSAQPHFFAGGHPLAQYASRRWGRFPSVDTSGGNVTYAALSLAERLGAEEIAVYGADFSYPAGRTYARGTYLYPLFESRQTRFSGVEAQFSALLFRTELRKTAHGAAWYYETPTMERYRARFEAKAASMHAAVLPVQGGGAPLTVAPRPRGGFLPLDQPNLPPIPKTFGNMTGVDFLAAYHDAIRRLPPMQTPWSYRRSLSPEDQLTFTTLLPGAAAIKRRHPHLPPPDPFQELIFFSLKTIETLLNSFF